MPNRRFLRGLRAALAVLPLVPLAACAPAAARPRGSSPPDVPVARIAVDPAGRFEAGLLDRLRASPPDRRHVVLLDLAEQVDHAALAGRMRSAGLPKLRRRETVIAAHESLAARTQAPLGPLLDRLLAEGRIDYVRPVAIVNRLLVEGRSEGILELAARPEIARVQADWTSARRTGRDAPTSTPAGRPLPASFTSWAVEATGADRLWAQGLDGRGVLVAAIDSGAAGAHEQLAGRRAEGARGWFDPVEGSPEPADPHGHGTSVLSQAVGGNPARRVVGLAPGARWAAALGNWHNHYSRSRMTLAADWVFRTARPDVLINAWSHDEGACTSFDLPFLEAWRAAEIFVVFPAGNAGPGAATGESPAQLPGTFSVAALTPSGTVHPESSRGPSRCGSTRFPSLAVPGADLPFAYPTGTDAYGAGSGTSLAAGVLGGAAALLLQAEPELGPADLEALLVATARDLPPAGPDDATGAGALDLPAALAALRARADRRAPESR